MIGLVCAVMLAAPPAEPRLQWDGDYVRVVYRYSGKWAIVTSLRTTMATETKRTADAIELTLDGSPFTLTADGWYELKAGATVPKKEVPGKWVATFPVLELGHLSEKYESSGRGPGTVSTGEGDPGGVSYGSYQLASRIGRADAFVKKYYPTEFDGLKGGTPEFTAKWKALAERDPVGLHKNEHEYIKATHHDPQVKKLLAELKFDVSKRNRVVQDAVWSTAVHHGPNTDVIVVAAKPLLKDRKIEDVPDAELLTAIYAERGRKTPDGTKLARFKGVSDRWIPGLTKRFVNELKDALDALK
jgi:hypothetical protein